MYSVNYVFSWLDNSRTKKVCTFYLNILFLQSNNNQFSPDKTKIAPSEWPVESENCPVITGHRPLFAALILGKSYLFNNRHWFDRPIFLIDNCRASKIFTSLWAFETFNRSFGITHNNLVWNLWCPWYSLQFSNNL